jgi:hypothetical protein
MQYAKPATLLRGEFARDHADNSAGPLYPSPSPDLIAHVVRADAEPAKLSAADHALLRACERLPTIVHGEDHAEIATYPLRLSTPQRAAGA